MPKGRVKFVVKATSTESLRLFREQVETQLAIRPIYRRDIDWAFDPESRVWVLDISFGTLAAARAFRAWFQENAATIRPLVTGRVSGHVCSHGEAETYSCRDDPRSQYREVLL